MLVIQRERGRIDAVAQTCWCRAIGKYVTQVRATAAAGDFGATHEVAAVFVLGNRRLFHRCNETGPATAGIKLGRRVEERLTATDAALDTGFLAVPVGAAEGRFGAFFAGDVVLRWRQASPPFGFGGGVCTAGVEVVVFVGH